MLHTKTLPRLFHYVHRLADPEPEFGERGARIYNGNLGQSPQRGPETDTLVRVQGASPPEAERLFALSQTRSWQICAEICFCRTKNSVRRLGGTASLSPWIRQ